MYRLLRRRHRATCSQAQKIGTAYVVSRGAAVIWVEAGKELIRGAAGGSKGSDVTFTTLLIEGKRQLGPSDVPGEVRGRRACGCVGPFETGKT